MPRNTKYVYRNIKTGKKVYSPIPLNDTDLVLVRQFKDTQIKSNDPKVIKK